MKAIQVYFNGKHVREMLLPEHYDDKAVIMAAFKQINLSNVPITNVAYMHMESAVYIRSK